MSAAISGRSLRARRRLPHERSPATPLESAQPQTAEVARPVYGMWRAQTEGDTVCELLFLSA